VRLNPGTTKNDEGRIAYLSSDLLGALHVQLALTKELEHSAGIIIPWVFHRKGRSQIRGFRKVWTKACRRAGVPGMVFHDLRRTAIRNMLRAGVNERVAMKISGHRTRSVFERYNIVSEADLKDAAKKVAAHGQGNGKVNVLLQQPTPESVDGQFKR
jgi:integrase